MTVQAIDVKVIEDKKAEQVKLMRMAREILEKDGATPNELESVNQYLQQADVIDKTVENMKRLQEMEMAQNEETVEEQKAALKAEAEKNKQAEDLAGFKHIGEAMKAVYYLREKGITDERLQKLGVHSDAQKDMSSVTGTLGGFLLPTQQRQDVLSAQGEASRIRKRAMVIPMANRTLEWTKLDMSQGALNQTAFYGGIIVYRTSEAEAVTGTQAKFKKLRFEANAMRGLVYIPEETIMDSPVSLEAFYRGPRGFGGAMAWKEDWESIRGEGGDQMIGTLGAPCTLSVARNTTSHVEFIDFVTMYSKMLLNGLENVEWDMSQSVIPDLMQLKDDNDNFIWMQMAANNMPNRLLGQKINFTEKVPPLGTKGDVMLCDYSWYVMADRMLYTFDIDKSVKFVEGMIAYKVTQRNDGAPWLDTPITLADGMQVSPFVALE